MTKLIRISPTHIGDQPAWQLEIDDVCVQVLSSRTAALEAAHYIVSELKRLGEPCDAIVSTDERPVRIAA